MTPSIDTAAQLPAVLPEGQDTAIAVIVAPENFEQAIAALPPEKLTAVIWWLDEVIRRAKAARSCALVEAEMAMARGELLENVLWVNGQRHILKQDERATWQDIPGLAVSLHDDHGVPWSAILRATSEMRVTDLRSAIATHATGDKKDALDLVEDHRPKKPGSLALVNIDDPYRRKK